MTDPRLSEHPRRAAEHRGRTVFVNMIKADVEHFGAVADACAALAAAWRAEASSGGRRATRASSALAPTARLLERPVPPSPSSC